jgi:hypothetical protein
MEGEAGDRRLLSLGKTKIEDPFSEVFLSDDARGGFCPKN